MPLTKMFKLGCAARFFTPPPPPPGKQDKPEPAAVETVTSVERSPELILWDRAAEAAHQRKHHPDPTQADILIPWSHGTERTEVQALASTSPSGRATLFLRTSLAPLELALRINKDFFKVLQLTVKPDIPEEEPKPDNAGKPEHPAPPSRVWLVSKAGHHVLTVETAPGQLMYGNVLTLTSTRVAAEKALEYLESVFPLGFACIVPHDVMESSISTVVGTMRITKRTAVSSDNLSAGSLATVFELEADGAPAFDNPEGHEPHGVGDQVVARCVLVYADGSSRPSAGPTIESIAVRSDYQGSGLVLDLFNAIEGWFVKFWTLDTLDLNRVFKATNLKDCVVDLATDEDVGATGQHHVFTDKILLYEVMHFACNTPHPDDPRGSHGTHLPPESHAIKYYPRAGTIMSLPTMYYAYPKTPQGWRSCDNCRAPETVPGPGLLVCGSCTLPIYWRAHYCGRACQREDWGVHKLWCGKTYDEVCAGKENFEASLAAAASS